ncbi:defense protein l(2)34Fc isoform X2 [Zeugodacus cucurbitae]|nr:defense protein l(2)34Fc isoform X2 [Zeugodacus cucurbitae]XP_011182081.2 defense protein l(2)34Fc isoform X2 [Zeugodacus cucurbitae]XP_054082305.1 defense protein l(2)34Fc isoform X2 [Zeugodacus cucurbitae]XP_054082306.1 defense protein l(2)34Fc isoform X2 [Zeugodacus cucurbitae]
MFRLLLLTACLAAPAYSYSAGAPTNICSNGLTPEHGVDGQSTPVPYSFSGDSKAQNGKVSLTLGGSNGFLGFAVQARDANHKPVGKFKVVEVTKSQTLTCSNADDTLTHKKIPHDSPIKSVAFDWDPAGYTGKVKFVATVAQDGGTYWIRKVLKEVEV